MTRQEGLYFRNDKLPIPDIDTSFGITVEAFMDAELVLMRQLSLNVPLWHFGQFSHPLLLYISTHEVELMRSSIRKSEVSASIYRLPAIAKKVRLFQKE
jgi:hypothetical protein